MNDIFKLILTMHNYSVILFIIMVFVNLVLLTRATELFVFRTQMAYTTPLTAVFLTSILFTGIVMMLFGHLHFNISNVIMIIIAIAIIILEIKRIKPLKYLKNLPHALPLYKNYAKNFLLIELGMSLLISLWMWL